MRGRTGTKAWIARAADFPRGTGCAHLTRRVPSNTLDHFVRDGCLVAVLEPPDGARRTRRCHRALGLLRASQTAHAILARGRFRVQVACGSFIIVAGRASTAIRRGHGIRTALFARRRRMIVGVVLVAVVAEFARRGQGIRRVCIVVFSGRAVITLALARTCLRFSALAHAATTGSCRRVFAPLAIIAR